MGREQEMLEVKRALAATRLVTLTGTGGSGKTRLALEVARDLFDDYPDGVWLVELAPLLEGALVPKAVAEALRVTERPEESLTESLSDVVRDRELLLVLDNCEHLVDAAAQLVDNLLSACPRLRILATSREALDVSGEVRRVVPPLSLPDVRHSPAVRELERADSVKLFSERALQRDPAFTLTEQNAQVVAEICKRLEGMPLAIELAAARVGTLSLEQISGRLDGSLELLTRGGRTAVSRQRTLRGTLDWSYNLLSEPERVVFRRLSVFAGGWTLEAAEVVCSGGGIEEKEVMDLLSRLVEKSLVVGEPAAEGGLRYRMLEPIRQYAREKLEMSGKIEEIRRRHTAFFLSLAERAELTGPKQGAWLERLEAEHDNLRDALSWSLESGDPELELRLAAALSWFWGARGHFSEGARWFEAALAKTNGAEPGLRAGALYSFGRLLELGYDLERAQACIEEALALYKELGNRGRVAECLMILGWLAMHRREPTLALALLEESLAAVRELASQGVMEGNIALPGALNGLGNVACELGDFEWAQALWQEALELCREQGDVWGVSGIILNIGYAELARGNQERATALLEDALTMSRELGLRSHEAMALLSLGTTTTVRGDPKQGKALLEEGLGIFLDLQDKKGIAESLEGLAEAAGALGQHLRAADLWGAAAAMREVLPWSNTERMLHEPQLAAARSTLNEAEWKEAFEEGKAMTLEKAIAYALAEEEPSVLPYVAPDQLPSSTPQYPAGLSAREVEVLRLVASGMTSAQVAKELFLSPRTVDTHLTSIYQKIGVNSRAAAIRFALEHDLS